jgi:hypothetical protein
MLYQYLLYHAERERERESKKSELPVQRARKFSAVFGTTLAKSCKPKNKVNQLMPPIPSKNTEQPLLNAVRVCHRLYNLESDPLSFASVDGYVQENLGVLDLGHG